MSAALINSFLIVAFRKFQKTEWKQIINNLDESDVNLLFANWEIVSCILGEYRHSKPGLFSCAKDYFFNQMANGVLEKHQVACCISNCRKLLVSSNVFSHYRSYLLHM